MKKNKTVAKFLIGGALVVALAIGILIPQASTLGIDPPGGFLQILTK